eukprot:5483019-Pleurochrysis_carterae.AAC.1
MRVCQLVRAKKTPFRARQLVRPRAALSWKAWSLRKSRHMKRQRRSNRHKGATMVFTRYVNMQRVVPTCTHLHGVLPTFVCVHQATKAMESGSSPFQADKCSASGREKELACPATASGSTKVTVSGPSISSAASVVSHRLLEIADLGATLR